MPTPSDAGRRALAESFFDRAVGHVRDRGPGGHLIPLTWAECLDIDAALCADPDRAAGEREAAERFARKAHAGQADKAGAPYTGHLGRVAARARAYAEALGWSAADVERAEIVGWLHDTLEDRRATADEIYAVFGQSIAYAIGGLTRYADETYVAYIEGIVAGSDPLARVVKLADLDDNLDPARGSSLPDSLRRRYEPARETLRISLDLNLTAGQEKRQGEGDGRDSSGQAAQQSPSSAVSTLVSECPSRGPSLHRMRLVGSRGAIDVEPGDRFIDGEATWRVVGLTGGSSYSASGIGRCPDVVCFHVGGPLTAHMKRYTHDGVCVWNGDTVAVKLIASRPTGQPIEAPKRGRPEPSETQSAPLTPTAPIGWREASVGDPKIARITAARADLQRAYVRANGPLNYAEHRLAMAEANAAFRRLREIEAASATPASGAAGTEGGGT